ncbi:MAG: M20/M25/M40 family metallo-hydrolase, partial [Candidatus Latescibacteria bacterium]|nr:M20/M25/M40 family metallo-hydrolase [Candidatus Latescibacterota bacterium]
MKFQVPHTIFTQDVFSHPERYENMVSIDSLISLIDDGEVVQLARDMVGIPSVTHQEGPGMVRYLERWFRDLGIPTRLVPCSGDRAHFFADYGSTDGPGRFLFNGHQDIKPVDGMTIDPYGAEIRDGRMYGRGACDMKGAIAGFMCAFKALVRAGHTPAAGITFYSDIEEEFSGPDGFLSMIDRGLCDGYEGVVSGEPTELQIHIGNMGAIATAFRVAGKAAHASMPQLGVNAIH